MILRPTHTGTSEHQAQKASDDLARHQARVRQAEDKRRNDPLGDNTKLADWQAPSSWGEPVERVPCRRRGIPGEMLRFANGEFVYRLVVVLHGIIAP